MRRNTKYMVPYASEIAKFTNLRHAMLFAIARSEEYPGHMICVYEALSIVGQYHHGKPTPEFKQHHIDGIFH